MLMKIISKEQLVKGPPVPLPLFNCTLSAGFPSPADDYFEKKLDLNELLITHPAATFFVKVEGDSMIGAGIHSGDMLVVDRSLTAEDGKIIVALIEGEFTVKRFVKRGGKHFLVPENSRYKPIEITEEKEFQVWGVVTYVVHRSS